MFGPRAKQRLGAFISPLTRLLVRRHWHPNTITMLGLLLNLVAAVLFASGHFFSGGITVLIAGLCDSLDGEIARASNNGSKFGALLDSTLDRYSEIFIAFGLAVHFIKTHYMITTAVLFFALAGSLMVSYVRARAEGLGEECVVGLMQRPERIVIIGISALIGKTALIVALWTIALMANYTVIERLWHIRKKTRPVELDMSK